MKTIQLFCIPYSGGSGNIYDKWNRYLNENIELCPVELAGRGKRIMEPLYNDVEDAIEDLAKNIIEKRNGLMNYAIWGHSLGSLLAYEVYYKLIEKGCEQPIHLYLSGRGAPQDKLSHTNYHLLQDKEFLKVVYKYGGNTMEIMQHEELRALFLPILRNDFKLSEVYDYKEKHSKIMCDLSIVNGDNDESINAYNLYNWSEHAGKNCDYKIIKGGHFFILDNIEATTDYINETIQKKCRIVENILL